MPNFIEWLANIAENNSKFLSVIQSLSDVISNIHQLVDSWMALDKVRLTMRYNIMIEQLIISMFKQTSFHDITNDTNERYRTIIL
jgi:predicted RNA binding protein with dsRBD fold (UPF0201 family)